MFSRLFRISFSITLLFSFFDSSLQATNSLKSEVDEGKIKIAHNKRNLYQSSKSSKGQLLDLHKLPEAVTGRIYKGDFFILPKDIQDFIINLSSPLTFRSLNTLYNYYVTGIPRRYIGDYTTNTQPEHQKFFREYKEPYLLISQLKNVPNFIPSNSELRISSEFSNDIDEINSIDVIDNITKSKIIESLIIFDKYDKNNLNLANIKKNLITFIKKNNHIQNLTIFTSCFDTKYVEEISKKGVITTLSVKKYMDSASHDDFYQALANIPQLKKLELITSATLQQLNLMTNHPTLEHLTILPTEIDYDQAMSFLNMPKLKYLYSLAEEFTTEQIQELQKIANLRNIELDLHEGPKKL